LSEERSLPKLLIFGKWDPSEVVVNDKTLRNVISLKPVHIPHSSGRHEHEPFRKLELNIVERLANKLMRGRRNCGKKSKVMKSVEAALAIIHLETGENPLQVLVKAIENSAPREDTTRVSYGGIIYFRAVDVSPTRRVDLALRYIAEGAKMKAFNNPKTLAEALAEEIMYAAKKDATYSYAVARKEELERHALASR